MSEGTAALDAMIASLRRLPDLATRAAAEAAPLVQAAVRQQAAAGKDPYGKTWAPKRDGGRALADAASSVTASAKGAVVQIRVDGGESFWTKMSGSTRRQILPDADKLPPAITDAIQEGARRAFAKAMGT
jgi:hypothetical protein